MSAKYYTNVHCKRSWEFKQMPPHLSSWRIHSLLQQRRCHRLSALTCMLPAVPAYQLLWTCTGTRHKPLFWHEPLFWQSGLHRTCMPTSESEVESTVITGSYWSSCTMQGWFLTYKVVFFLLYYAVRQLYTKLKKKNAGNINASPVKCRARKLNLQMHRKQQKGLKKKFQ